MMRGVEDGRSSSPVLDVAAVVVLHVHHVVVPVPEHDAAVVGRLLHDRHRDLPERLGVQVAARLLRRRQAEVDLAARVRRRPPAPRVLDERRAVRVVVEPDVDALEDPRRERRRREPVRERVARTGSA